MEIIDKRKSTAWVPAIEVLNEALPVFRKENFKGIRNIVLMDKDYRNSTQNVSGRYCKIDGTNQADIEMFFDWHETLPTDLKESRLYIFYQVTSTLLHEIYHHIIRGQKRLRRPPLKEETAATKWAASGAMFAIKKTFSREDHEDEWNRIKDTIRRERIRLGLDTDPTNTRQTSSSLPVG